MYMRLNMMNTFGKKIYAKLNMSNTERIDVKIEILWSSKYLNKLQDQNTY